MNPLVFQSKILFTILFKSFPCIFSEETNLKVSPVDFVEDHAVVRLLNDREVVLIGNS